MHRRLMEECGVAIYCDLHAHSRRHNIFIYGCESKRGGSGGKLSEQVFPLMLHKNAADKVQTEDRGGSRDTQILTAAFIVTVFF